MAPSSDRWPDERLDELQLTVKALASLPVQLAVLQEKLSAAQDDAHQCRGDIRELRAELAKRDEQGIEQRKKDRAAFYVAFGTVISALLSAIALIVTQT